MILAATPGKQPEAPGPLAHLYWVWFSVVMGLAGLALAWSRASHLMGEGAIWVANALGVLAAVVWLALAAASLLRLRRYPRLIAQDLAHPVRHAFVAAIPVGLLLLCAVAVGPLGPRVWIDAVWVVAAGAQFLVTVWVLGRWLHEPQEGQPSMWLAITQHCLSQWLAMSSRPWPVYRWAIPRGRWRKWVWVHSFGLWSWRWSWLAELRTQLCLRGC